ncbi:MAG: dolichyl-phosphate beta-glucosyltransferase [Kiritimatiellia bacterium]
MNRLAVVIPCRNEAKRLPDALQTLAAWLDNERGEPEIIFVDDASTDGSGALLMASGLGRVLTLPVHQGKGGAVRAGMLAVPGADWILMSDIDCSAPLEQWRDLLDTLERHHADLAIGSRRLPGAHRQGTDRPPLRRLASALFARLARLAGLRSIHDTQCGFKLMRNATVRPLMEQLHCRGFAFDVELLLAAQKRGLRIVECPIRWHDAGHSSVNLLRHAPQMLVELLGIYLRNRTHG